MDFVLLFLGEVGECIRTENLIQLFKNSQIRTYDPRLFGEVKKSLKGELANFVSGRTKKFEPTVIVKLPAHNVFVEDIEKVIYLSDFVSFTLHSPQKKLIQTTSNFGDYHVSDLSTFSEVLVYRIKLADYRTDFISNIHRDLRFPNDWDKKQMEFGKDGYTPTVVFWIDEEDNYHRDNDLPALIEIDPEFREETWYRHGEIVRKDGYPTKTSIEIVIPETLPVEMRHIENWTDKDGEFHRINMPVVIKYQNSKVVFSSWMKNGVPFREGDKPTKILQKWNGDTLIRKEEFWENEKGKYNRVIHTDGNGKVIE